MTEPVMVTLKQTWVCMVQVSVDKHIEVRRVDDLMAKLVLRSF